MSDESKYSPFARAMLVALNADAVILVVLGGELGDGATRAERPAPPEVTDSSRAATVAVLRAIADDIEKGITEPDQAWARRGRA